MFRLEKCKGSVERRLAAHVGRRASGRSFSRIFATIGCNRLDVGRVGKLGVGHDRRGVRIDGNDYPIALRLQSLDRLTSRIVGTLPPDRERSGRRLLRGPEEMSVRFGISDRIAPFQEDRRSPSAAAQLLPAPAPAGGGEAVRPFRNASFRAAHWARFERNRLGARLARP